jgi:CubicO group peptidase (beta-lactamase class C family)
MKALLASLALAIFVSACGSAPGPAPEAPARNLEAFARTVESLRQAARIPGLSVAVARDGEVLLAEGFGLADVEGGRAATPETVYPIGSITKTFTSTLMLQLAAEGRLDLDDFVADYVDWQVPPDVRVRHVLSHTSEGVPGTRYRYSSRFNWLDDVVASSAGEPFRGLLVEKVLKPAGLEKTIPAEDLLASAERLGLARPYRLEGGEVVPSDYPPLGLHSSSGLGSTALDLARYGAALDDGRLLDEASRERAFSPTVSARGQALPYGLGWFTQEVGGLRVVWHGGWWPGSFSGLLVKVPERRLTLAVLANSDGLSAPQSGASNVLLKPIANAFFRQVVLGSEGEAQPELEGLDRIGRGLVARWRGEPEAGEKLLAEAVACCPEALRAISDDDLLRFFGESDAPALRALGFEAGRRTLADFPDDAQTLFNLALALGRVRPDLEIQGPEAGEAVALFERVLALDPPLPDWMEGWSAYLAAEQLAESDPERARALAERALATGADTDGLRERARRLLERLGGSGGV